MEEKENDTFHLWSLTDEFAINHFRNFRIDYVSVYTTRNSIKTKYLDYLVKRISESTNEGLIVRYAHLLFHFKEEQEEKEGKITVRQYGGADLGMISVNAFSEIIKEDIKKTLKSF
mgnify:CR=1 FL=1